MNAKRALIEYEQMNVLLDCKKEEICRIRESLSNPKSTRETDRVQTSLDHSKQERTIAELIDLERQLDAERMEIMQRQRAVIKLIEQLPLPEYMVIYERYIKMGSLQEVAERLGKSSSWVSSIQSKGIKALQRQLDAGKCGTYGEPEKTNAK